MRFRQTLFKIETSIIITLLFLLAVIQVEQANALSPVSFTTQTTITSHNSQFQQVYENGTNSAITLDTSQAGIYYQNKYLISSGSATSTSTTVTSGSNTVNGYAYFATPETTNTVFTVGRDTVHGVNIYALLNTNNLATINSTSITSSNVPLSFAESKTKLYTALYNTQQNLYLGISNRNYTSYSENSLYTGNSTFPAYGIIADNTGTGTGTNSIYGAESTIAETVTASSALAGKTISEFGVFLSKVGSPAGTITIGTFDNSNNLLTTFCTIQASNVPVSATFYVCNFSPYTINAGYNLGVNFSGGDANDYINVSLNNSNSFDGSNSYLSVWTGSSWSNYISLDLVFQAEAGSAKTVVYDGSPDTVYTFFQSGSNSILVAKYTGSATVLSTALIHAAGKPFSVIPLTDRILVQTSAAVYQLLLSNNAITMLYPSPFLTLYEQSFTINVSQKTFNTWPEQFANATYAINYFPSSGTNTQTGVMIQALTSSAMSSYNPQKFYYLSKNNLILEGSGTTWTYRTPGTLDQIMVTPWTEHVQQTLVKNSTLFSAGVFKLICGTGIYNVNISNFAVGYDGDCTLWQVLPSSSATVGRSLQYARTVNLVWASPQTAYTITLTVANPVGYFLTSSYGGKTVDSGYFDSAGDLSQNLLYGNCYTVQVTQGTTGNVLQVGSLCANNVLTKPISLSAITIPNGWLGTTWSHTITRYFDSSTGDNYASPSHNQVLFTFQKNVMPYNGSLFVSDNTNPALSTIQTKWYNFTNVNGIAVANLTGSNVINSNQTLYFTLYENGIPVATDVSSGQGIDYSGIFTAQNYGLLFGIPIAIIFPVFTALIFPRSLAYFGIIVTGAVIGLMEFFKFLPPLGPGIWALSFAIMALGVAMGYKRT